MFGRSDIQTFGLSDAAVFAIGGFDLRAAEEQRRESAPAAPSDDERRDPYAETMAEAARAHRAAALAALKKLGR